MFTPALGAGIVLAIISVIGGIFSPGDFFHSYLMGYLFWLGLTLGCMGIVMLQYLTAGAWGIMTRRDARIGQPDSSVVRASVHPDRDWHAVALRLGALRSRQE